jgi:hypothetical protein
MHDFESDKSEHGRRMADFALSHSIGRPAQSTGPEAPARSLAGFCIHTVIELISEFGIWTDPDTVA